MITTAAPYGLELEFYKPEVRDIKGAVASSSMQARVTFRWLVPGEELLTAPRENREDVAIDEFLETVYLLCDCGDTRLAIDVVFQKINSLLTNSQFRLTDAILSRVDEGRLSSTLMVGFLSITLASKDLLCARAGFYDRVLTALTHERGKKAAAKLLTKYK